MPRVSTARKRTSACAGALVSMTLGAGTATAEGRAGMVGASPILPARFLPGRYEILAPSPFGVLELPRRMVADLRAPIGGGSPVLPRRFVPARYTIVSAIAVEPTWRLPLMERSLSPLERAQPLAGDLIEAVARIEPIYDPTRIDGPEVAPSLTISAGTARMQSVFGDRWQRIGRDPNVNAKVKTIALAWRSGGAVTCDDFVKTRPHRPGEPALTALNETDCRELTRHAADASDAPLPVVLASADVPVFAAPLPGARMSSEDFWARRREKIAQVQVVLRQRLQAQRGVIETASLGR